MLDVVGAAEFASLDNTDDVMAAAMARLERLLKSPLGQDDVVEISAIFNNVSYLFLYLESNEAHVDYSQVLPWRRRFYDDPDLDRRLGAALAAAGCADAEVERSRLDFLAYLRRRRTPSPAEAELAELASRQKGVLSAVEQDTDALLSRLGAGTGGRPGAVFYALTSRTADPLTRAKLGQAWRKARDRRLPELLELVDRTVSIRRAEAPAQGFGTPLAETLARSRVDEATAAAFLHHYVELAVRDAADLCADMSARLGTAAHLADDFGRYVRESVPPGTVATFELDACLDFAFAAARRCFGLTMRRVDSAVPNVIVVEASTAEDVAGQITFDLWNDASAPRSANTTRGARNRADWGDIVQRPAAFVACRFERTGEDARINFQNVHSLFHEFGHAVNHLLIRRRLPTQSGLDYLPLERLENLSMWFEKWVYHPELAARLGVAGDAAAGVTLAQRVKALEYRRTHVDRAVTALLDFELHRRTEGGLAQVYDELAERWPLAAYCSLGDFPPYFSWPMFQANPGANFAYLWGAADSAAKFAPFLMRPIDADTDDAAGSTGAADLRELFAPCLDFELPSERPDAAAVFSFYRERPDAA